jgi:LysM repeat protein
MVRDHVLPRVTLAALFVIATWALAACYKDAGENVQPTSIRVQLSDLTPTDTPLSVTPTADFLPTDTGPTATRTLVPTTTPADAEPDSYGLTEAGEGAAGSAPTNTPPPLPATFTPVVDTAAEAEVESMIVTPGLSDIRASNTPRPTIDPTLMPTPTPIPADDNPCLHVVRANDTLFAIANDNEVSVDELIAANPTLLSGQFTFLQIGWELRLPGCEDEEASVEAAVGTAAPTVVVPTAAPAGGTTVHVVQPGETIYAIARRYGVSPQAIITANNLANPDRIRPGDQLTIPGQ